MPAPDLYFIRHGETDWNAEGRLQGQRDIHLNQTGRAQAAEAGRRLRDLADPGALPWWVSPLARTMETARLARRAVGLDPEAVTTDDRLRELTFGEWEGATWRELRARDPVGPAARARDKWGFVPPGGESYAMLATRVAEWLAGVTRESVVVSHGGVARALLVLRAGASDAEAAEIDIWQGRVLVLREGGAEWV